MVKKILIGLVIVLVGLALLISVQPDDFEVERSIVIAAPASAIFPHVNNLKQFNKWNPWADVDPAAIVTFEGPVAGEGAIMRWDGNMAVGKGSMTIVESDPHDMIELRMDFIAPMEATNEAEFTFVKEGKQTRVTWSMSGENNFIAKAMSLVFDCDKMVGDQFERGLARLKATVEGKPATH